MHVPTLIFLGAAGGLLRGALDVYARFVSWQCDRRAHRQLTAAGTAQGEAPRFQAYFDPAVDIAAAAVHGVMGACAAVLFGTTGQISGEYAALVVGMSAPLLLTQLGRIQTVNEVVTADRRPVGAAEAAARAGAPSVAGSVGVSGAEAPGAAAAVAPSASPPRTEPRPATSPGPVYPPDTAERPPSRVRPMHSPRPPAAVAGARTPEPTPGEPPADPMQHPDPTRAGDAPFPAGLADGTGPGLDGPGAPRWRHGPAIGEEGL